MKKSAAATQGGVFVAAMAASTALSSKLGRTHKRRPMLAVLFDDRGYPKYPSSF